MEQATEQTTDDKQVTDQGDGATGAQEATSASETSGSATEPTTTKE